MEDLHGHDAAAVPDGRRRRHAKLRVGLPATAQWNGGCAHDGAGRRTGGGCVLANRQGLRGPQGLLHGGLHVGRVRPCARGRGAAQRERVLLLVCGGAQRAGRHGRPRPHSEVWSRTGAGPGMQQRSGPRHDRPAAGSAHRRTASPWLQLRLPGLAEGCGRRRSETRAPRLVCRRRERLGGQAAAARALCRCPMAVLLRLGQQVWHRQQRPQDGHHARLLRRHQGAPARGHELEGAATRRARGAHDRDQVLPSRQRRVAQCGRLGGAQHDRAPSQDGDMAHLAHRGHGAGDAGHAARGLGRGCA